jgi:hypothetical protein
MLLRLEKPHTGKHKWIAIFSNGKRVPFGAVGYDDYTLLGNNAEGIKRREAYRRRHKKDLDTHDPYRPGYLSYYILWGDTTNINEAVRQYNRRFF